MTPESNGSNKGLNKWFFNEELMNPLAGLVAFEGYSGEQLLATREKERGGNKRALFGHTRVITNRRNNTVDDVLRDIHLVLWYSR